jgi:hypothetical protein
MERLKRGDLVELIRSIEVNGKTFLVKGAKFEVKATFKACCYWVVDIGYAHPEPIVLTCDKCGNDYEEIDPVWLPVHYFKKVASRMGTKDPLRKQLMDLEKLFKR